MLKLESKLKNHRILALEINKLERIIKNSKKYQSQKDKASAKLNKLLNLQSILPRTKEDEEYQGVES